VEITENTSPMVILRKEFRPDSGGSGRFRGGVGQIMEFCHRDGEPFVVSRMFDRITHAPRGRDGGGDGAGARTYVMGGETLSGMGRSTIPAGGVFVLETAGGGGRGDPAGRDEEAQQQDLLNGLVSAETNGTNAAE
jgi:N-methylhydantoinase B